jgi:hypothetical protein
VLASKDTLSACRRHIRECREHPAVDASRGPVGPHIPQPHPPMEWHLAVRGLSGCLQVAARERPPAFAVGQSAVTAFLAFFALRRSDEGRVVARRGDRDPSAAAPLLPPEITARRSDCRVGAHRSGTLVSCYSRTTSTISVDGAARFAALSAATNATHMVASKRVSRAVDVTPRRAAVSSRVRQFRTRRRGRPAMAGRCP